MAMDNAVYCENRFIMSFSKKYEEQYRERPVNLKIINLFAFGKWGQFSTSLPCDLSAGDLEFIVTLGRYVDDTEYGAVAPSLGVVSNIGKRIYLWISP